MSALNFKHLRYFWAVAHEGNLTRAARQLNVSQSALSLQIKKLEERLEQPLFERRGRQLVLTEAGRIALDYADEIFAAGDELVSTLGAGISGGRDVLRIGALSTLSRNLQMEFLAPLLERNDVGVVVRSGVLPELLRLLETQQVDVVLTNQAPQRDAKTPWLVETIAEQRVSLIGPPSAKTEKRPLADVLGVERLIVPTLESPIRIAFDTFIDKLSIRPRIFAEVDDMALIRLLARSHAACAVIPPIVVRDEIAAGELIEIENIPDVAERFYAVTIGRRFINPLLREVINTRAVPKTSSEP